MCTVEVGKNPRPVAVTRTGNWAKLAAAGVRPLNTGTGLLTVRLPPVAAPPPGGGVLTPIANAPGTRNSAAGTVPLNWVALTNVVGIRVPATVIAVLVWKFVPVTVNGVATPTAVVAGLNPVIVGAAVSTLIENEADPPPGPGFDANPDKVPGRVSRSAGIVASIDVGVIAAFN